VSIFFLKSLLSVVVVVVTALLAMFTAFEVFGRSKQRFDSGKFMKIHKIIGIFYFLVFFFIAYFCLDFIMMSKAELSARSTFHGICALSILILMGLKIVFIRIYRNFYGYAKLIGILISVLTFLMVGISGGYYMVVTNFGSDQSFDKILKYKKLAYQEEMQRIAEERRYNVTTEPESIKRGETIFAAKCSICHDAYSTATKVGPGLKGVLKNPELPVSRRPARPENIIRQLRQPFNRMPSFGYLTEEEVADIIAFLNTL
jgi:cytochrome c2